MQLDNIYLKVICESILTNTMIVLLTCFVGLFWIQKHDEDPMFGSKPKHQKRAVFLSGIIIILIILFVCLIVF